MKHRIYNYKVRTGTTIGELARLMNMPRSTFYYRLKNGKWLYEEVVKLKKILL